MSLAFYRDFSHSQARLFVAISLSLLVCQSVVSLCKGSLAGHRIMGSYFLLSLLKKYFTAVTLLAWPLEKYLPQNHGSIHQEFVLESSYTAWAEPMLAGLWTYSVPCDRHRESSLNGEATLGTWLWWFSLLQKPVFCMFFTSRTWTCFCR